MVIFPATPLPVVTVEIENISEKLGLSISWRRVWKASSNASSNCWLLCPVIWIKSEALMIISPPRLCLLRHQLLVIPCGLSRILI